MRLKPASRRFKRSTRFFAATVAFTLLGSRAASAGEPAPRDLDGVIVAITTLLEASNTPGASVAIVTNDGILFAGGLGTANVALQTPATADTRFRIGSISKGFTALAALKLQEEGRLDLNATLASLAPEVEFENSWEISEPVRIVHLLEHTSGFDGNHLTDYANSDPRPHNLLEALAHDPDSRRCRWRPGTRFAYCNSGPAIVAYVIEKITGEAFEDYVRREFFRPIGMGTATFYRPEGDVDLAQVYQADGVTPFEYWHIAFRPAGSINASASDMAAYVRFLLHRGRVGERVIIREADMQRMERPMTNTAARAGLTQGYGLYNHTVVGRGGRIWHGHGGGVQGGRSEMRYLPEAGVGYAIAINAADDGLLQRMERIIQRFLTQSIPPSARPAVVPISDEVAKRYAGWYIPVNPGMELTAILSRMFGVGRLSFANGEADFVSRSGASRFVGVTPVLLRKRNESAASLVLLEPSEVDDASLVINAASYRRVPAVVAWAPFALAVTAAIMVASTILFLPVWLAGGLVRKIRWREHLVVRFWPLAASVALVWFVGAAFVMSKDVFIFQHYGNLTWRSLGLAISSVAALVVAVVGLFLVLRVRRPALPRALRVHALLVLGSLSALALYLAFHGVIPLVTWG